MLCAKEMFKSGVHRRMCIQVLRLLAAVWSLLLLASAALAKGSPRPTGVTEWSVAAVQVASADRARCRVQVDTQALLLPRTSHTQAAAAAVTLELPNTLDTA